MNVLIAPLDWGLGHATRCIPVIKTLEDQGHTVFIAGSGPSLDLLKLEFPSNQFFEIASYQIRYPKTLPLVYLVIRIPSLLRIIHREHQQVADIVAKNKIDFVISDNRYGCYHDRIPSAIIIHQLSIQAPFGSVVDQYHKKFLHRFNEIWVPDTPQHSLSGKLSISNIPHKFIGPLSRMKPGTVHDTRVKVLALISGPEPQRTLFERKLNFKDLYVVRGLPSEGRLLTSSSPHLVTSIFNHLPSSELNDLINRSDIIIARSGYSTIMDLAALKKKAIFVPTPGQTEQLYLAKELDRKNIAPMFSQDQFSLQAALDRVKNYSGFTEDYSKENYLDRTLREFLD